MVRQKFSATLKYIKIYRAVNCSTALRKEIHLTSGSKVWIKDWDKLLKDLNASEYATGRLENHLISNVYNCPLGICQARRTRISAPLKKVWACQRVTNYEYERYPRCQFQDPERFLKRSPVTRCQKLSGLKPFLILKGNYLEPQKPQEINGSRHSQAKLCLLVSPMDVDLLKKDEAMGAWDLNLGIHGTKTEGGCQWVSFEVPKARRP